MPSIRTISYPGSYFAKIAHDIQSSEEYQYESDVYSKLCEAEIQAAETAERLNHKEVMAAARTKLGLDTSCEK